MEIRIEHDYKMILVGCRMSQESNETFNDWNAMWTWGLSLVSQDFDPSNFSHKNMHKSHRRILFAFVIVIVYLPVY